MGESLVKRLRRALGVEEEKKKEERKLTPSEKEALERAIPKREYPPPPAKEGKGKQMAYKIAPRARRAMAGLGVTDAYRGPLRAAGVPPVPVMRQKPIASMKKGGKVKKTGMYRLHKGETIKPAKRGMRG